MNPLIKSTTQSINSFLHYQSMPSLKIRQEQITLIVLGVLACIAVSYAISRYLFKAKFEGQSKPVVEPEKEKPKVEVNSESLPDPIQGEKINDPTTPSLVMSTPKGNVQERPSEIQLSNGKCRKIHDDGTVMEGEFINDKLNGPGSITFATGQALQELVGEFRRGIFSSGVKKWSNGATFEGEFEEGRLVKGTKTWPNKTKVTGTFDLNGKLHGPDGHKIFPSGHEEMGEFEDDELHGRGKRIERDGEIQEGIFMHGVFESITDEDVAI